MKDSQKEKKQMNKQIEIKRFSGFTNEDDKRH